VNHVLCGLAANAALPAELLDRLIAVADADVAADWRAARRQRPQTRRCRSP
jgi:hypothetical protein